MLKQIPLFKHGAEVHGKAGARKIIKKNEKHFCARNGVNFYQQFFCTEFTVLPVETAVTLAVIADLLNR